MYLDGSDFAKSSRNDPRCAVAEALKEPEKSFKAGIEATIASLGGGADQEIRQAGERAQLIADKLRLPAQAPQLRSFRPVFLFSFLPSQTRSVNGSFPAEYPNGAVAVAEYASALGPSAAPQMRVESRHRAAGSWQQPVLSASTPFQENLTIKAPGRKSPRGTASR